MSTFLQHRFCFIGVFYRFPVQSGISLILSSHSCICFLSFLCLCCRTHCIDVRCNYWVKAVQGPEPPRSITGQGVGLLSPSSYTLSSTLHLTNQLSLSVLTHHSLCFSLFSSLYFFLLSGVPILCLSNCCCIAVVFLLSSYLLNP